MRVILLALLVSAAALPLAASPAAAGEVDVCVPMGWDHGPRWECVATAWVPDPPPVCYRDPSAWPPREVCLA